MRSTIAAHIRSLVLPVTATAVVPLAILGWPPAFDPLTPLRLVAGGLLTLAGLAMLVWTVSLFIRIGRGTLAPWDPTRTLVVVGPFAHLRNPMISGVTAMLAGETIGLARGLAGWVVLFVVINHVYFILLEEPGLVRRFGPEYEEYRRQVPRWIPRRTPWRPPR
jgi:protein-S-isoprenylcysteine O-methyltransferase Ste14